jgi:hypothetical protein
MNVCLMDHYARYLEWNRETARHFLYGRQRGSPVFLAFDVDAAELIGTEIGAAVGEAPSVGPNAAVEAFLGAVRNVVVTGKEVRLDSLPRDPQTDIPTGVAFLAVMVLAAHRMVEDEEVSELAYFKRLGELLGTNASRAGLPTGAEETRWVEWNAYLTSQGFLQTAYPGNGPLRYLRYVRSQAVLRDGDREVLWKKFADSHVPSGLDPDQLEFWLREQPWNRRYMREGFTHDDPARRAEFFSAAYQVYQSYLTSDESVAGVGDRRCAAAVGTGGGGRADA